MAPLILILLTAVIATTTMEMIKKYRDRKTWMEGYEYSLKGHGIARARLSADPLKEEFIVSYNWKDDMFYDKKGLSYHPNELQIKIKK